MLLVVGALLLAVFSPVTLAVKCLDCVGKDCMGSFCEGDYCVLSQYAPRWGTIEWGKPQIVKGCMTGSLLRKDIRDHCEAADDEGEVRIPERFFFRRF
uniref:Lysozyme n=1 Tax=Angiostrongylus cantonensis TaxID=6313 RepID=A0A0K0DFX0_ANGCA